MNPQATSKPKQPVKKALLLLLVITAVIGATGSCLLYVQHRKDQKLLSASGAASQSDTQQLVKRVSRLMVLPAHEKPTVATVSDYRKLQDQAFFKNARNGDKVLIYAAAKTAVLYDPKQNLILAVSPLNIQSPTPVKSTH